MYRVFVGPKQKTIKNTNFFNASITLIGNNKHNNIAFCDDIPFEFWNDDNNAREIEIYNNALNNLTEDSEVMAYNPKLFSKCTLPRNVKQICKNSDELLQILDNKIETRKFFKNVVPMLDYYTIKGKEFNYEKLKQISQNLIVQSPMGSGGAKTFFCNESNHKQIESILLPERQYSISAYQIDNTSYTIYGMIGKEQIEVMPVAQQLFEVANNIEWIDSTYNIEVQHKVKEKLIEYTTKVCEKIQNEGYRGIFNIDFISTNNELYLIETNPRFGGTISEIDLLLQESDLPSIFDYNYRAFNNLEMPSMKRMKKSLFE